MALTTLLAPIGGEHSASPAGEDMLFSNDFDIIQEARRFEDPSLDQGEWVTEIKEADWHLVIERCSGLLETRSKDLRLAVWLTEALAIRQGLVGLSDGYDLITGLCTAFWDTFYPLPEADDVDYRLGNVGWLIGRSAELLRTIPLTDGSAGAYSTLDWEIASQVAQAVKRDPDNADEIARGKATLEQIEAARRASKPDFYRTLLRELSRFESAFLGLETELDHRAGDDAPSFRKIKDAYEVVRRLAERFARDAGITPEGSSNDARNAAGGRGEQEAGQRSAHSATPARIEPQFHPTEALTMDQQNTHRHAAAPSSAGSNAAIVTRTQAVAKLREVAAFFRRTEPHSPAAYLADKAAVWAEMPLHEWLQSVMKEGTSLEHINELLGVSTEKN